MRGPLRQTCHIAWEVGYFLLSLFSRIINAAAFQGSMHQTLSARVHIEARDAREAVFDGWACEYNRKWIKLEARINAVFFWQEDHCASAWDSEVTRARKTLARNGDL